MTSIDAGSLAGRQQRGGRQTGDPTYSLGLRIGVSVVFGVLLVGVVGGWAATATLTGAVIAPGTVAVSQHVKEVQHRDGGIVAEIAVREGDFVAAGDVLIRLSDVETRAERSIVLAQIHELQGRAARLLSERDGLSQVDFSTVLAAEGPARSAIIGGETTLFVGNLLARSRQKEQLDLQLDQLGQEVVGLEAQLEALDAEIELVSAEHARLDELATNGLIEGARVYAINRELARLTGERGEAVANMARAEGRMSEVRLQIIAIDETARNEAQRELRVVQAQITELSERLLAAEDRLDRVDIRSPIAGIVNELNVTTIGGVITPAQTLVTIVPDAADLRIETRLSIVDVDQVSVGQPVKLRFSAFNQRTTPELTGEVVHVSAAAQRDSGTGELFYLGEIAITDDVGKLGDVTLIPGMPVEVFAQTAEVTALSYLVKPFLDQAARAFREE
ncbi:HlyD family type I secretion periplasmic adaptor subunit [Pelagibacterium halotolerans]|uniref:Membrane fusion protein (MFP) family protein n=1 Tax=Pelagibacterium halotolerans (strain DSM 22347 / JCM 15775 / CGMCC 1.7692 / B2) TaxID=1082931 RepID=G4RB80_PELHB|nr:HlyD family type I secretion periplasmic adaptor subunit [Pelagibacterium halotolerans]AEQ51578.1 HlyD family secretion protein [Pelagibacterium halotolerans B2]QJR18592.1 HlyD family type I secretion periplasmic adaptor subunit [Pelagibacterium halotolerans]SEA17392.1 HlyD family secretion protein [Pelagibacterium halotolerans]